MARWLGTTSTSTPTTSTSTPAHAPKRTSWWVGKYARCLYGPAASGSGSASAGESGSESESPAGSHLSPLIIR
eukprot:847425-Rhodomonas_salina.3